MERYRPLAAEAASLHTIVACMPRFANFDNFCTVTAGAQLRHRRPHRAFSRTTINALAARADCPLYQRDEVKLALAVNIHIATC